MNDIIQTRIDFIEKITNYKTKISNDKQNIAIWCPFCKNKNKNKLKLAIQLNNCVYHCWTCDKKGYDVSFLISKINPSLVEESKKIFKQRNTEYKINYIDNLIEKFNEVIDDEHEEIELPRGFMFLSECFDNIDPDITDVLKYAIKRGTTKHKLYMLRMGVSLDNEFRRCLILPSYDKDGKLNFYTCRKIDVDTKNQYKYINSNISKSKIIFNELNLDFNLPITIVEGPLDLIKTNDNSVCLLGSSLNEKMKLFKEIIKNKTTIYLALDHDVYYTKTLKIAELLLSYDIDVKIIDTSSSKDVGDMSIQQFKDAFNNAKSFYVNENDILLNKIRNL